MLEAATEQAAVAPAAPAPSALPLEHLPILDSARGVAILLVLMFHALTFGMETRGSLPALDEAYVLLAGVGWCGVDVFFVLSGFLITRILLHTKSQPRYFQNFYARRALRIFPLYYVSVLAYFALARLFHLQHGAAAAPWLLTYTSNLIVTFDKSYVVPLPVAHFWSLAIEEQFYFFWPLLVLLLSRRGLVRACIALSLLAFATRYLLVQAGNADGAYRFTLGRLDALVLGGLVTLLATSQSLDRVVLRKWAALVMWASGAVTLAIAIARRGFVAGEPVVTSYGISFLALFLAAALFRIVTRTTSTLGPTHAFLSMFGRYSYGMYVFHQPIATAFVRLKGTRHLPLFHGLQLPSQLVFLVLFSSVTLLVAMLSYHLMEKQFLRLKVHFE